ncbi:monooxygenase [Micromonospora rosaria]|uniref:Monooxygenase n=1 Tax=Micromonospora rosaria TaxID=47874 RepID=A0A136PJW2_9ACTN|nr:FAD-dependent monooxygenase [Micromonospora rosaria]KXK58688.1 monooxygenase [Micromonospora rosaria]
MTVHTRTALVIGGGVAGPVVATALRRAGVEATVYEAYDSAADGVGGGLSIAPNGQDALDAIGLGDVVREVGRPLAGTVLRSWKGAVLGEISVPPGLPELRFVWRAELSRGLRDAAAGHGVRTVYGKRLERIEQDGERVTAHFADGTSASADVLVGADGIRSTVRRLIDPAAPRPEYAGLLGFAAPVADTGMASTGRRLNISYGRRASCGYLVYDDSSGGWFMNLPHREPMTVAQARAVGTDQWLRTLREAVADDRSAAPELLRRTDPADLLITGPLETLSTVPTWSRGRVVLVGDAVHATSPSAGQGASLAFESAVQLARCLRDLPYAEAFVAYEGLRRERVERIIAAAARTNRNKANASARIVRDVLLPITMRIAMKMLRPGKMTWQFDHHIDWDAPVPGTVPVRAGGA